MVADTRSKIFDMVLNILIFIAVLVCLIPILHVASISLSSNSAILAGRVYIWPVELNVDSYKVVFADKTMIKSLVFTAKLTVVYTLLSMLMTVLAAYPLSKKGLKGRNLFLLIIVFTMYFSGGMIPDYILIKNLGLLNNFWALVLPGLISAFNMIVLKTFFSTLPESLEESAFIDGASYLTILIRIVLPLSLPVLATLSLFYAVGRWNYFMDALLYITDSKLYPIQLKIYQIIYNNMQPEISAIEGNLSSNLLPESLKAASVMFAIIPIIMVYPWLQKYFISGVMIGAIKG
ncbi:putative aldouronate transport system permease protein [Caldicoprobacter guelmensis]|uniref:carbohydrate ABC transporter permease n=1 Tax=Caldicoprobacter guelmensis TaxID=1170224 RepID=UPI00195B02FF|nr:carbohydrate ABC transporter permease [Caldicoprobacter guelmensis]MBM7582059.1 putative aldouronate transport system permease protein [Caldicoprobacter guelmensis]